MAVGVSLTNKHSVFWDCSTIKDHLAELMLLTCSSSINLTQLFKGGLLPKTFLVQYCNELAVVTLASDCNSFSSQFFTE